MQAVILAAGKGLRLRPFTNTKPKGLVPINGKPLLEYTLESLPTAISQVTLVIGYLGNQIQEHFKTQYKNLPIDYLTQEPLKGTGDAIMLFKDRVTEKVLVVNGDDLYVKQDLEALIQTPTGLLVKEESSILPYSILESSSRFTGIGPNPPGTPALRCCGAYVIDKSYFSYPPVPIPVRDNIEFSLPHTLASMTQSAPISVIRSTFWQQVGTPEELEKAQKVILK